MLQISDLNKQAATFFEIVISFAVYIYFHDFVEFSSRTKLGNINMEISKRSRSGRVTYNQIRELITYMNSHRNFANKVLLGKDCKQNWIQEWEKLAIILNRIPKGVTKSAKQWQIVWRDLKFNTSKKVLPCQREKSLTDKRFVPLCEMKLTDMELKLLDIIHINHEVDSCNSSNSLPQSEGLTNQMEENSNSSVMLNPNTEHTNVNYANNLEAYSTPVKKRRPDNMPYEVLHIEDVQSQKTPERCKTPVIDISEESYNELSLSPTTNTVTKHDHINQQPENQQEEKWKIIEMLAEASKRNAETAILLAQNITKQNDILQEFVKISDENVKRQNEILGKLVDIYDKIVNGLESG